MRQLKGRQTERSLQTVDLFVCAIPLAVLLLISAGNFVYNPYEQLSKAACVERIYNMLHYKLVIELKLCTPLGLSFNMGLITTGQR